MATAAPATSRAAPRTGSIFIVSQTYDWLLFLLPPILALGVGVLIANNPIARGEMEVRGQRTTLAGMLIGAFVHAHLFAVFFRSHANPKIFETYPARFTLVPAGLYYAMVANTWALVSVSVLATFWDVYHSGLQTFGFARIYDAKQGNDPTVGRRLDWWINHLLYAGPIVAGATMAEHFHDFLEFEEVGSVFFTSIPVWMDGNQVYFTWAILGAGALFVVYYVYSYWRLHQQGYQISALKVYLLVSTGIVSIYSWGFNTWGEAFFIMNFFHALQYFGIVWAREKDSMARLFRLHRTRYSKATTLLLFLGLCFSYGSCVEVFMNAEVDKLLAITLVVSIMHFWYDGFIWSVQRKQV